MQERDIERKLRKAVIAVKCVIYKFTSPGNDGVPDRVVISPNGVVYFIETKRPKGGRVAKLQTYQQGRITGNRGNVRVILNEEQIDKFIQEVEAEEVL